MKKFLLAALAVLVLVGCRHEQSELNFAQIKGKASVTGRVFYEATSASTGKFDSKLVPAAGVDVVLEVANAAYTAGAEGNKKYVATTDSAGNYLIEGIPVGQRDIEPSNVTLRIRPFLAAGVGDSVYYEFTGDPDIKIIANEQTRVEDVTMTLTEDVLKNRAIVKGVVMYEKGLVKNGDAYEVSVLPAAGVEVVARFSGVQSSQEFVTKTNAEGEYEMAILIAGESEWIQIYARSFEGKHSEDVSGNLVEKDVFFVSSQESKEVKAEEVVLAPELLMTPSSDDLHNAGVITGKLLYEAGLFAEGGAYEVKHMPAAEAELVVTVGSESFNIKTDAEGTYKFVVPLKSQDEATVILSPRSYRALYSHVDGEQIVTDSADFAATVNPSYQVRREQVEFAKDIVLAFAGADAKEGEAILSGIVLYEAGYAEKSAGNYEIQHLPAAGAEVVVTVDYKDYTIKTDAKGAYRITIPAPSATFDAEVRVNEYRALYTKYNEEEDVLKTDSATFVYTSSQIIELAAQKETVAEDDILLAYDQDIIHEEGAATIKGVILFEAGYEEVSKGNYQLKHLPAPGAKVIALVSGKEYTVKTDTKGAYSLVVPVPDNGQVSADVYVAEYRALYDKFVPDSNRIVTDSATFRYNGSDRAQVKSLALTPAEEFEVENVLLTYHDDITPEKEEGPAIIAGTILFQAGYSNDGTGSYIEQSLPAVGAELCVRVDGKDYWLTTNAEGIYTLVVPMDKNSTSRTAQITQIKDYRAIYTDNLLEKDSAIFRTYSLPASQYVTMADSTKFDEITLYRAAWITEPLAVSQRNKKLTITGTIKRQYEKADEDPSLDPPYADGKYYKAGEKVEESETVYITISGQIRKEDGTLETTEFFYKTTAKDGEYRVVADVYDTWLLETTDDNFTLSTYQVKVEKEEGTFRHYYYVLADNKWTSESVEGNWSSITTSGYLSTYDKDENTLEAADKVRSFTPSSEALNNVHGLGKVCDHEGNVWSGTLLYRSEDPFGWRYL